MEFLDQANLPNWLSCLQKHQKFKVSALKEDQKHKVFLDFYTSSIFLVHLRRKSEQAGLDLRNNHQEREGTLQRFENGLSWVLVN